MEREDRHNESEFRGFRRPNYTPVPDEIFDRLLPDLREAELKALLYITRRTFGFKKDSDAISLNQFLRGIRRRNGETVDRGCGVRDRTTLTKALRALEQKNIIISQKRVDERGESEITVYALCFVDDTNQMNERIGTHDGVVGISYRRSGNHPPLVVADPDRRSGEPRSSVVGDPYPQETVRQQTDGQEKEQQQHSENVVAVLLALGVTEKAARTLVRQHALEGIKAQIEMVEYRRARDRAAVLVQAIREDWAPPAGYEASGLRDDVLTEPEEQTEAADEASSAQGQLNIPWRERAIAQYGIEQATLELWERVQQLLPRFVGTTAYNRLFVDALITPITRGHVQVVVPEVWQKYAIAPEHRSALEVALSTVMGQAVTVKVTHSH